MNSSNAPNWLRAGTLNFSGGADSGRPASDLEAMNDVIAFAVNTTMRGGKARPRPGWTQRKLTFARGVKTPFEQGFFHTGAFYRGDSEPALLSSHGGRAFRVGIDESPGNITATTADFTIPAASGTVSVSVVNSGGLESQSTLLQIGSYQFTIVSIDSLTAITVKNDQGETPGTVVVSGSALQFFGTFTVSEITPVTSDSTSTTASFVVPAVNATVAVAVLNATKMVPALNVLTIGAFDFQLLSVDSPSSVTLLNQTAANVGQTVAAASTVTFSLYDVNDPTQKLNWQAQAENYWILQNNKAFPVIYDGAKTFRANPAKKQVPVGNVMAYAQGRLAVALKDRQTYRIGDLVFGSSGSSLHNFRDSVLYFTETDFLNEGGDLVARVFGAPSNAGEIRAMKSSAMTDTSLGQGPLLVTTPDVVFTVQLPFDRAIWKSLPNPLQTVNPIKGGLAQDSTILVNTDVYCRSLDGIRSYITAQRQFNGSPGNTPISQEVGETLSYDSEEWLEFGSGVLFDNRLLITISPQMTGNGCYHRGLVVLDFNLTTGNRMKAPPAWEGVWTGLRILKIVEGIVNGVSRCFIWALNDESKIELWELSKTADNRRDDDGAPIQWEVNLPSYSCRDLDRFKKLKTARFILTDVVGTVTGTVEYRTDEGKCWNSWDTFSLCQHEKDCATPVCAGPTTYEPGTRYPIRLKEPPDTFDSISQRKTATGYEFQPRLKITGYAALKQFRLYCLDEPESLGIDRRDVT